MSPVSTVSENIFVLHSFKKCVLHVHLCVASTLASDVRNYLSLLTHASPANVLILAWMAVLSWDSVGIIFLVAIIFEMTEDESPLGRGPTDWTDFLLTRQLPV